MVLNLKMGMTMFCVSGKKLLSPQRRNKLGRDIDNEFSRTLYPEEHELPPPAQGTWQREFADDYRQLEAHVQMLREKWDAVCLFKVGPDDETALSRLMAGRYLRLVD